MGDTYTSHTQQRHINASDFFHSLSGKAKQIADEEASRMADTMLNVLHNRKSLGPGLGKFPRWNPSLPNSKGQRSGGKSKKMFASWYKQRRKNNEYWIATDGIDPEHHNYAQQLVTGRGWPAKVVASMGENPWSRLTSKNGLIFSTQMPQGLEPWFKLKQNLFSERIKERIKKEL